MNVRTDAYTYSWKSIRISKIVVMREEVSYSSWAGLLPLLKKYSVDNSDFSSPELPNRVPSPPLLLSNGYRVSYSHVKRPGREANHSLLVLRLRNSRAIPPLLLYAFMACTKTTLIFLDKIYI
jgi:hypothetical protein